MRTRHLFAALLVSALSTPTAASAQNQAIIRKVFTSDSLAVSHAQTSPDGKWLVFAAWRGTSSSLWITLTAGGPLVRLTSEGHDDQRPRWFARGDRIVFESSRPNRDGGRQRYLMTLGIDPATGKPVGAPRQISGEPVLASGLPSPDGRWLSYISAGTPSQVKVVPATGGAAQSLAEAVPYLPSFSPDSRQVYFVARGPLRGKPCPVEECELVLKQVPVGGGPAQVLSASTGRPVGVVTGDPRFTIQGIQRLGVGPVDRDIFRTVDGREVGTFDLPSGTVVTGPTGDGLGMMVRSNEWTSSVRVASVYGAPIKILTRTGQNWPEAWTPSGDAVITDRPAQASVGAVEPGNDGLAIELLPLDGTGGKVIPVPGAIRHAAGWTSSVGPWFSYLTSDPLALHAINVTTGQTRTITKRPLGGSGLAGRGGMEQDGSAWLYAEADAATAPGCATWACAASVTIKRTDPATGETQPVRTFSREPAPLRRYGFNVHGTQLLHFAARGDSVDLVLTRGPSGSPERLATFQKSEVQPDEGPVWSWKGDRAAICGRGGADQHPILMILTVPAVTGGTMTRQDFELGTGDVCWDLTWQPDDHGLFMVGVLRKGGRQDILQFSLTPGSRPVALTANDPDAVVGEYLPSPDGKHVAYPVQNVRGSSIYVVDLKPMLRLP